MSAFTSAAHAKDSDTINQLRAENTRLRQALLTMHGTLEKTARVGAAYVQANETLRDSMIRWAARAEEAEELLEAIGAGGVGSPIRPQAEQPTTEDSSVVQADPVAWVYQAAGPNGWNQHLEWTPTKVGYYGDWERIPLYTHPQPAQQPLTREQLFDLWKSSDEIPGDSVFPEFYDAARAIERAHGIGGEA